MADLLNVVTKATSSFLELHKVSIDNWVFKLYYKFTTSLLLLSSVLTSAKYVSSSFVICWTIYKLFQTTFWFSDSVRQWRGKNH